MATVAHALRDFRNKYSAMLSAGELLRVTLEAKAGQISGTPDDVRAIQSAIAERYGMTVEIMIGSRRDLLTSHARTIAMALCCEFTNHTLFRLGSAFSRNHSTLIYARRSVSDRLATNAGFAGELEGAREAARKALVAKGVVTSTR